MFFSNLPPHVFNVSQKKISTLSLKHFKKTSYICTKSLKSNNKANYKTMGYTNKEKLEWTMIFIHEFAVKKRFEHEAKLRLPQPF